MPGARHPDCTDDGVVPALTLPPPRTPEPRDAPTLRWGILAPGGIARSFAQAVQARTGQHLQAVASRSLPRAQDFAADFGIDTAYGSYTDLVADPEVDVVYVASPHSEHRTQALLATAAGKPVLVEKAFARNATEARDIVESAGAAGVFAMEAMWTRFLPHIDVVRRCLEDGLLGEVHTVHADHGQALHPDGPRRLADPALAGGALLDLGIYPVSFAHFVLGDFVDVTATGVLTDSGVDAQAAIGVTSSTGAMGVIGTTMVTRTPTGAAVCGTQARLEISGPFYAPRAVVRLVANDGTELDRYANDDTEHGLHYEAVEVARRVAAGEVESPLMPHVETLQIMDALDDIRAQVGVRYSGE